MGRVCSFGAREARTLNTMSATNPALFTPEAVATINRAYARACGIIADQGARDDLRQKLAEHMMHLARAGETDEGRLCSLSIIKVLGRDGAASPGRPRPV